MSPCLSVASAVGSDLVACASSAVTPAASALVASTGVGSLMESTLSEESSSVAAPSSLSTLSRAGRLASGWSVGPDGEDGSSSGRFWVATGASGVVSAMMDVVVDDVPGGYEEKLLAKEKTCCSEQL